MLNKINIRPDRKKMIVCLVLIIVIFAVLRQVNQYDMTGAICRSAFVAGLFAHHPLHVESVAWIAKRQGDCR